MFGHHKLLKNGAVAQGVVTSAKYFSPAPTVLGSWRLELTIPFPDGTDGSLSCKVDEALLRSPGPGDLVPVRYDESDHSKIVVDEPALKERRKEAVQVVKDLDAERAKRVAEAIHNSPPGTMELGKLTPPDPNEDPRIGIARMSIRAAQRRGDLDAVNRLNAQIIELQTTGTVTMGGPASGGAGESRLDRIQKLADLHERGALTDAEFAAEKAKVLSES